jgi:hypothetical protein
LDREERRLADGSREYKILRRAEEREKTDKWIEEKNIYM